jgi:A/G-specific adenine glycosylase
LNKLCVAYVKGKPEAYPVKAPKKAVPQRYATAYVLTSTDGYVLLRRRDEKGLLGGMAEVPSSTWHEAQDILEKPKLPRVTWTEKGGIQHVFTHFRFDVRVLHAHATARAALQAPYFWVRVKDIGKQALPTVMRKILQRAEVG